MEFVRKILYLYDYDGGLRGASIGFVKLSQKETTIKIQIILSENRMLYGQKIYLLYKDKNAVNKVFFSSIIEEGKEINILKNRSEIGRIKGDISGVLVGGETNIICAGVEDDSIRVADYIGEEKIRASEEILAEEITEKKEQKEEKPEEPEREEEPEPEEESEWQEEPEEEGERIRVEVELDHDMAYEIHKLFATRPGMYPFADDEMEECVQIAPGDFSGFPKEYWHMGSNSFLLQGYYNYRHLLLARKGNVIYVGIPGQYHRRDKYLADMFGFGRFKSIHKSQGRLGDFGYWMKEIEVPPSSDAGICVPDPEGRNSN